MTIKFIDFLSRGFSFFITLPPTPFLPHFAMPLQAPASTALLGYLLTAHSLRLFARMSKVTVAVVEWEHRNTGT